MHTVTSKDGTPISVDRFGEGPPLVLIEGALNDLATTVPLGTLLSSRFTVFAYDRRGRGASGDVQPYSVDREIEDLDAVLAETGEPPYVFGNCSGGALVLEAAARGREFAALALYEPPYSLPEDRSLPARYSARLESFIAEGRRGDALELFMKGCADLTDEAVTQVRSSPMWAGLETLAPTLRYDDALMGDCSLPVERLSKVRTPTLVIDGGDSLPWARNGVQALADVLPNGRRHSMPGHTHLLVPDAVAPLLVDFFTGTRV
ncbi:alpha/beta hydrolase [Actinosynnema sp. NPDC047251]|uniref:Alpha/beta hydrolase fold containing protein n=1 Tax=Saccharothrix espanaensis (strain ATCC 51144 / DSM 44229 / JCM 9112 / NBRC 15066 / NRRL 15764) TaxID=1179773 RepID=K0JTS8_SACES|nr:alpha/beta hydrolase [Saccharothrix espanaensis]CCH31195.1 alpha/beta hydrolase fold containing protein [Saccharothrix espanaensis DSM 44229]